MTVARRLWLKFQHTATRRWLLKMLEFQEGYLMVSTHSHPKVAALPRNKWRGGVWVSTHSHPKVAATDLTNTGTKDESFNTQPPEGGCVYNTADGKLYTWFQHTATRRWLPTLTGLPWLCLRFQHTATRRWLPLDVRIKHAEAEVSTHSHPKVAAKTAFKKLHDSWVSTHSHPKVAANVAIQVEQ